MGATDVILHHFTVTGSRQCLCLSMECDCESDKRHRSSNMSVDVHMMGLDCMPGCVVNACEWHSAYPEVLPAVQPHTWRLTSFVTALQPRTHGSHMTRPNSLHVEHMPPANIIINIITITFDLCPEKCYFLSTVVPFSFTKVSGNPFVTCSIIE